MLLLDSGDFDEFQFSLRNAGEFSYFTSGSAKNVLSKTYTFIIPSQDRYYVLINNGGGLRDGAVPIGDVDVYLKVDFLLP